MEPYRCQNRWKYEPHDEGIDMLLVHVRLSKVRSLEVKFAIPGIISLGGYLNIFIVFCDRRNECRNDLETCKS